MCVFCKPNFFLMTMKFEYTTCPVSFCQHWRQCALLRHLLVDQSWLDADSESKIRRGLWCICNMNYVSHPSQKDHVNTSIVSHLSFVSFVSSFETHQPFDAELGPTRPSIALNLFKRRSGYLMRFLRKLALTILHF